MKEEPFIGGNLSDATRAGDTVRRRAGPWTPAVHALLRFLEGAGFEAPRARGIDEQGREILGYIEGDVYPGWPEPAPDWVMEIVSDTTISSRVFGRRLRRAGGWSRRQLPRSSVTTTGHPGTLFFATVVSL